MRRMELRRFDVKQFDKVLAAKAIRT